MAGQEDSIDLMAAVNQVVTAINDLVLQTTPAASGCCGVGGGTYPPSSSGTEGEAPPENWDDLDDEPGSPEYQDRKCAMANYIHAQLESYIDQLRIYDVDAYAGGMTVTLITLLGGIAGQAIFPLVGAVAGATIGFLVGLAMVIISGGFDLPDLLAIMAANEDELVCALYATTNSDDGIEDYIDILVANGASAADILFVRAVLVVDFLNYLMFQRDPAVEAVISGYTGPVDCDTCPEVCPYWTYFWGSGTEPIPFDEEVVISSEWDGGSGRHRVQIALNAACTCEDFEIIVSATTGGIGGVPMGDIGPCVGEDDWSYLVEGYGGLIGSWCGRNVHVGGTGAFTITVEILEAGCL